MNSKVKVGITAVVAGLIGIGIGAAGGGGSDKTAPTAGATPVTVTKTVAGTPGAETTVTKEVQVPVTQTVTVQAQAAADTSGGGSGSGCDQVKEASLTGTPAEITAAMNALIADKSADGTAREYAQYYLGRDKGQSDMQTADLSIIRMYCG